jgi:hypothetical protein
LVISTVSPFVSERRPPAVPSERLILVERVSSTLATAGGNEKCSTIWSCWSRVIAAVDWASNFAIKTRRIVSRSRPWKQKIGAFRCPVSDARVSLPDSKLSRWPTVEICGERKLWRRLTQALPAIHSQPVFSRQPTPPTTTAKLQMLVIGTSTLGDNP